MTGEIGSLRLVSATGIVGHDLDTRYDSSILTGDPSRQAYDETRDIELISHETRLSTIGEREFEWLIGIGTLRNRDENRQILTNLDGDNPPPFADLLYTIDEVALFGEGSVRLPSNVTVSLGGRLVYSKSRGERFFGTNVAIEPRTAPLRFLPVAAVSWAPDGDRLFVYLRYQQGYRTGGVAIERADNGDPDVARFDPDTMRSIEAGLRANWDAVVPVELSLAGYFLEWKSIQADLIQSQGFPLTRNIGDGDIFGLTARAHFEPAPGWSLDLDLFANRTQIRRLLPSGGTDNHALPNIAPIGAHGELTYRREISRGLSLESSLSAQYVGRSFIDLDQQARVRQGDYAQVDAALALRGENWTIAIEALNLADGKGNRFAFGNPFTARIEAQQVPLRPRTFRLSASVDF